MDVNNLLLVVPIVLAAVLILAIVRRYITDRDGGLDFREAVPAVLMLLVAVVVIVGVLGYGSDDDTNPPVSSDYMYIVETDADNQAILSVSASTGGSILKTITTQRGDGESGAENISSFWAFDSETGIGPFNSYYAAFNVDAYDGTEAEEPMSTVAGMPAYILDPSDLSSTLSGTAISGTYNVFLVIPTVYWNYDDGKLYLSSSPSYRYGMITHGGMTAFAHTATDPGTGETKTYPYLCIGVYESYSSGGVLRSATGQTPTANLTEASFKALADALTPSQGSDYQLWNYYQWTLYKMMSYTIMGTKNSQWMMGDGPVNNQGSSTTGLSDSAGPYAASTTDYCKLLIENAWGSLWEYVGDTSVSDHVLYAGNTLGGSALGPGTYQTTNLGLVPSANGWISSAHSTSNSWDLISGTVNVSNEASPDYAGDKFWQKSGDVSVLSGGCWLHGANAGISAAYMYNAFSYKDNFVGARLAYLWAGDVPTQASDESVISEDSLLTLEQTRAELADMVEAAGRQLDPLPFSPSLDLQETNLEEI